MLMRAWLINSKFSGCAASGMGTGMGTTTTPLGSGISEVNAIETEEYVVVAVALVSVVEGVLVAVSEVVLVSAVDGVLVAVSEVVSAVDVVEGMGVVWWWCVGVGVDQSGIGVGVHSESELVDGAGSLPPSLNHHDP